MKSFTKEWLIGALFRAIWTFAEVALGFMAVGMAINEVDWLRMLSVSATAMIISFLKSIMLGIPEAQNDGTLLIDDSGENTKWMLQVDTPVDKISTMRSIRLVVDPKAVLGVQTESEEE